MKRLPVARFLKSKARGVACIKADEKKLDDIRVVRDFPELFPDDLSGLPPVDVRVFEPAKGASRKGFYLTKSLTMGSTHAFCQEERWCDENVY
ncbi:hypothetical protein Tco_0172060 [Tanacetum coccineum]